MALYLGVAPSPDRIGTRDRLWCTAVHVVTFLLWIVLAPSARFLGPAQLAVGTEGE